MVAAIAVAVLAVSYALGGGSSSPSRSSATSPLLQRGHFKMRLARRVDTGLQTGSVTLTDQTWVCAGPVDLDSVSVTMTAAAAQLPRTEEDAIHIINGCTGRIGRV